MSRLYHAQQLISNVIAVLNTCDVNRIFKIIQTHWTRWPAVILSLNFSFRWRSLSAAGSATMASCLQCLKITPPILYRTNTPFYHHLWRPYCWPCRHRNCLWFLPGRCAGQRVMWHTVQAGSLGQRPPSAAPHGAFLSFLSIFFSLIPSFPPNLTNSRHFVFSTRSYLYISVPADILKRPSKHKMGEKMDLGI